LKHQSRHSFVTEDQAVQMGADIHADDAVSMVSEMADEPRGLRTDVHTKLCELVATYKLPPMPEDASRTVKASATKILDGIMLRSFERTVPVAAS
jgi:hypothetical protein